MPLLALKDGSELPEDVPGRNLIFRPGKLSCGLLKKGWAYAREKCREKKWNVGFAKEYLVNVLCLSDGGVQKFLKGMKDLDDKTYFHGGDTNEDADPERIEGILSNLETDPRYYDDCCPTNPIWDLFEIEQAYETVMHNCMNVGKAVIHWLVSWSSAMRFKNALVKQLNQNLSLVFNLRVEAYKARQLSKDGSPAGYVAETYRAFLLLSPWLLDFLNGDTFQAAVPGQQPPTDKQMSKWTKDNLVWYLHDKRVRRVQILVDVKNKEHNNELSFKSIGSLKKWELMKVAKTVKNMDEKTRCGPNGHIPFGLLQRGEGFTKKIRPYFQVETDITGKEMYSIFPVLSRFFTILMDSSMEGKDAVNRANAYAAIAMSKVLKVVSGLTDSPVKEMRQKSCLFGCLRSITHLVDIPCLKAIHEGGNMGEGIVKPIRKCVSTGLRPGWQTALVQKFYRSHSMSFAKHFYCSGANSEENDIQPTDLPTDEMIELDELNQEWAVSGHDDHSKRFKRYDSMDSFATLVRKKSIISVVIVRCSSGIRLGYVTATKGNGRQKKWSVGNVHVSRTSHTPGCGLTMFRIDEVSQANREVADKGQMHLRNGIKIKEFCIGLPAFGIGKKRPYYYFIDGNGKHLHMSEDNRMELVSII